MSKKVTVSIQRTSNYEVIVDDDFDPEKMDTAAITDFYVEASQDETDDVYTDSIYIFSADGDMIYEEVSN